MEMRTTSYHLSFLAAGAASGYYGKHARFLAMGNGDAVDSSNTFPQGVTIFGRWTGFTLASGSVVAYLG